MVQAALTCADSGSSRSSPPQGTSRARLGPLILVPSASAVACANSFLPLHVSSHFAYCTAIHASCYASIPLTHFLILRPPLSRSPAHAYVTRMLYPCTTPGLLSSSLPPSAHCILPHIAPRLPSAIFHTLTNPTIWHQTSRCNIGLTFFIFRS